MIKKLYCFYLVWRFFNQGYSFVESFGVSRRWFRTKNPMFGGIKPLWLMDVGRTDKLLKIIKTTLSENYR